MFFWSVFSQIWSEYGEIQCMSLYLVDMRENTDQKNNKYGNFHVVFLLVMNQWVCESFYETPSKVQVLATITKFWVIISIVLIATLGSFGCYILLSACQVEMRVKRQLFWQASDNVRMQVPPAWCGWLPVENNFTEKIVCFLVSYQEQ